MLTKRPNKTIVFKKKEKKKEAYKLCTWDGLSICPGCFPAYS